METPQCCAVEGVRSNVHGLLQMVANEEYKYTNYLNHIDHSIDCIESWPEPISRHYTCLANISIKQ